MSELIPENPIFTPEEIKLIESVKPPTVQEKIHWLCDRITNLESALAAANETAASAVANEQTAMEHAQGLKQELAEAINHFNEIIRLKETEQIQESIKRLGNEAKIARLEQELAEAWQAKKIWYDTYQDSAHKVLQLEQERDRLKAKLERAQEIIETYETKGYEGLMTLLKGFDDLKTEARQEIAANEEMHANIARKNLAEMVRIGQEAANAIADRDRLKAENESALAQIKDYQKMCAKDAAWMAKDAEEIKRLHTRLEDNFAFDKDGNKISVEPGSIPDGIACRDETIRGLETQIERLTSRQHKNTKTSLFEMDRPEEDE